jgi:hypothetical protein
MLAQLEAGFSAVVSARQRNVHFGFGAIAVSIVLSAVLGGCMPTEVPLVGGDPADPGTRVAGVGYRSTVAPYTSLRPAAPAPWVEQNRGVAPTPQSGR